MPVITINFKGKKIKDHSIMIGQGCNIGRKIANDIVIDNLGVSGFHAQIDAVSATFVLRDLDSTNGTFVNNQRISTHTLQHNDSILIGKHELIFDCSDLENMKSNEANLFDEKTRILNTKDFRELLGQKDDDSPDAKHSVSALKEDDEQKKASFFAKIMQKIFG